MNKEKWNSLPAAVQQAFTDNSGIEASVRYNNEEAAYQLDNAAMPRLKQSGYDLKNVEMRAAKIGSEVVYLTAGGEGSVADGCGPVLQKTWIDSYAGKLPTAEIVDRAKELAQQYEAACGGHGAADDHDRGSVAVKNQDVCAGAPGQEDRGHPQQTGG